VAEQDRIVLARFCAALHDALDGPKHLMQIEGAGHNDWPGLVDAYWWRAATSLGPFRQARSGALCPGSVGPTCGMGTQVREQPNSVSELSASLGLHC
jgi:hypothetical protein